MSYSIRLKYWGKIASYLPRVKLEDHFTIGVVSMDLILPARLTSIVILTHLRNYLSLNFSKLALPYVLFQYLFLSNQLGLATLSLRFSGTH